MADTRSTSILGSALHDAGPGSLCGVELIPLTPSALAAAATLERRHREKQAASDANHRVALARALDAAKCVGLVIEWSWNHPHHNDVRICDGGGQTVLSGRNIVGYLDFSTFLCRDNWQRLTTEDGWTSLLDAMSALAETMPWWEVAP